MTNVHFLNVGHGNMTVVIFGDNSILVFDCNITDTNKSAVMPYLRRIMPKQSIDIFVNSHRDTDHLCGIKVLNDVYPIQTIWESGISGNTDATDYKEYMDIRRTLGNKVYAVRANQHWKNKPNVRVLNGKREDYAGDLNSQSLVMHIDDAGSSVLLSGDTDARVWKNFIVPESKDSLKCSVLLGSHHGSLTFFDDPSDDKNYYTKHMDYIKPSMTVLSIGDNGYGHPDTKAIKFYNDNSTGSSQGMKIARTDQHGNIHLELKGNGNWTMHFNQ